MLHHHTISIGTYQLIYFYNFLVTPSFPEGNLHKYSIEIGGKTKEQLQAELKEKNVWTSSYAEDLFNSKDFETSSQPEHADLIRLTVEDLGFPRGATTDEIYAKAGELGLELCPAEVGPQLRLQYTGTVWMYIGMKQIADRDGRPGVFSLDEGGDGLELYASGAHADDLWDFRLSVCLPSPQETYAF